MNSVAIRQMSRVLEKAKVKKYDLQQLKQMGPNGALNLYKRWEEEDRIEESINNRLKKILTAIYHLFNQLSIEYSNQLLLAEQQNVFACYFRRLFMNCPINGDVYSKSRWIDEAYNKKKSYIRHLQTVRRQNSLTKAFNNLIDEEVATEGIRQMTFNEDNGAPAENEDNNNHHDQPPAYFFTQLTAIFTNIATAQAEQQRHNIPPPDQRPATPPQHPATRQPPPPAYDHPPVDNEEDDEDML
jgi:hypothetical protein